MATEKHELNDEAWTDLGPTPCLVQSVSGAKAEGYLSVPARVALVISDAKPASLDAPAHSMDGHTFSIGMAGHAWARAENAFGALVVVSR